MMQNKLAFYAIVAGIVIVVLIFVFSYPPVEEKEYYGFSTFGACTVAGDCIASGCNSEICQSSMEEPMFSICIVPDKPTPRQLGYACGCVSGSCQWAK